MGEYNGRINVSKDTMLFVVNSVFNKDNHICVSCDVVDYMPQMIEVGRK